MDGNSSYYRCHDRCGNRSIKQVRLEQFVIDTLFSDILTTEKITELQAEIRSEVQSAPAEKNLYLEQLKKELREIEQQISDLVVLLSKVKHQRPLIEKLDQLKEERISVSGKVSEQKAEVQPKILDFDKRQISHFLETYRKGLQEGEPESKKAIFRSLIDCVTLDADELAISPNIAEITGFKVASPRGLDTKPCCLLIKYLARRAIK